MSRVREEHWAYKALHKRLAEKAETIIYPEYPKVNDQPRVLNKTTTPDWKLGNIFLFEPDAKRDIGETFRLVYPEILAAFEKERFAIPAITDIELHEKRDREASCIAIFIIRDSKRPALGDGSPWWYIRFNLDIKEGAGYSLLTELHLSLPYWLESDWAIDFMIGARDWQNPPTLSVERNEFSLRFESSISGWLSFADSISEMEYFLSPFRMHIEIAKAIDRFSESPSNRFLKSNMLQSITETYNEV